MKTLKYISVLLFIFFITSGCSEDLIETPSFGIITGKVVKKDDNQPLSQVKISTSPSTSLVYTDSNGNFTITQVPLGDYSVKAEFSGYLVTFQSANLNQSGQTASISMELATDSSSNVAPKTPTLISPADNAENQPTSVTLTWSCTDADNDPLTYEVILKNSANSNVVTIPDLTATTYTFDNLLSGVSYFWQVTANDGIHTKVYSSTFQFKTSSISGNRFNYVRKINGNYYLVTSNESGGNEFSLTSSSSTSFRPRVNNVANKIAFIRNVSGNNQIFVSKKDGTDVQQVTSVPITGFKNDELDFSWEANGNSLIYPNFDKLYKINKDGSNLTLLYTTPDGSLISECDWSSDGTKIALKTNNNTGYNVRVFVVDMQGQEIATILSNVSGGAGGINFSIAGDKLLYTRDVSGYQNTQNYRQLDSRVLMYNFNANTTTDFSALSGKVAGMNDLDARFSPNDGEIILMSTSNDNISQKNIVKLTPASSGAYDRVVLFSNAEMPDWE